MGGRAEEAAAHSGDLNHFVVSRVKFIVGKVTTEKDKRGRMN